MGFIPAYTLGEKLYLNITNRCMNNCCFCIRNNNVGVGYDLWLDREPSAQEVIDAAGDTSQYREVVFCGYGEPLLRPEIVKDVAQYLKSTYDSNIRINTNGLAENFLGIHFLPELKGLIDVISISLNASNAESYYELCKPSAGLEAFNAVLDFARESKKYIPRVILSVVDVPGVDIAECRKIAESIGVELRIRERTIN